MQLHALRVATDLGFQGTDGAESVDGLDDFEDVLVGAQFSCAHGTPLLLIVA